MNKFKIIGNDFIDQNFKNIAPATNFVPSWYKKSSQKMNNAKTELSFSNPLMTTSTYKKCSPFLDALTNGYMLHLTTDVEVTTLEDGGPYIMWRSTNRTAVTQHDDAQWDGLSAPADSHLSVYKWENTFILNTPKNYSILFTHPLNRFDLPFHTISGIVDTDKYALPIKFPFFLKKNFEGVIEAGTPFAQITFIKRDEWEREFIDHDPKQSIIDHETFFSKIKRSYKNNFWSKKVYK
jgi:hypothetical protein